METVNHKIRRLIRYYEHLTGSRDPVTIARYAGIQIAVLPLGNISGNYKLLKRKRWIFINEDIPSDSSLFRVVVAHELGHALLQNKTLLLTSGIEREANLFAASLLISDEMLQDYTVYTQDQFCQCTGYPKELLELRLK